MRTVFVAVLLLTALAGRAATNTVAPLIIVGKKDPNAPVTPYWMMPGYHPHSFQVARYHLPWEQPDPDAGQANNAIGQTTIGIGQPNGALGQPNNAIGQTTIGIGQPNNQIGQPTIGIGQPTIGIGQPNMQMGQTTIGIGQTTIGIGRPTIGIGQPTIGIGQPNSGIGAPSTVIKTPVVPSREKKSRPNFDKPQRPEHRPAEPQPRLKSNPKPQVGEERSTSKREREH